MKKNEIVDSSELKRKTLVVIQKTERALKKHLGLIKKREHIASIVAMVERLRGDIRANDASAIRQHLFKLSGLTKGFTDRVS